MIRMVTMVVVAAALAFARAEDEELRVLRSPAFRRAMLGEFGMRTEVEPRVTEAERALLEKVAAAMGARGGMAAARRMLENAVTPSSSAALDFALAHLGFLEGDLDRAAAGYARAIAKFPAFLRAHKQLGVVHVRAGRFGEAVPRLARAIELGGGDGLTYGLLGFACLQTDRLTAAESAYRIAILLQPDVPDWRLGLARVFFRQGRHAEVVALCDELIRAEPNRPEYRALQAGAYLGLRETQKATELYEMLDLAGHATPEMLQTLGDVQLRDGYADLAADAYLRALERGGAAHIERTVRAAELLAARGSPAEAQRLADRVREIAAGSLDDSMKIRLLKLAARAAAAQGEPAEEQIRRLEEIVASDPLDGETLILLAQHHAAAGDLDRATLLFERAAAIEATEADARLRHAQCLVRAGRYADALPLLKRAQELRPRDEVARYLEQVERMARLRRGTASAAGGGQ